MNGVQRWLAVSCAVLLPFGELEAQPRGGAQHTERTSTTDAQNTDYAEQHGVRVWARRRGYRDWLYVQRTGRRPRLLLSGARGEGFSELKLSPNGKWLMAIGTLLSNPVTGEGRVEQYGVLVQVATGRRIDESDFRELFGADRLLGAQWVANEPATLIFSDGRKIDIPDNIPANRTNRSNIK